MSISKGYVLVTDEAATKRQEKRYALLLDELCALPAEAPWVEFKDSNIDPDRIARTVSALANSARLLDKPFAYMVWGVEDKTHAVIGTEFIPEHARRGTEPLEFWLAKSLDPSPDFTFRVLSHPSGRVVLLEVPAANTAPVAFNGIAYIRIGETTPKLSDYPDRLRRLWTKLQPLIWEEGICVSFQSSDDVLRLIDYPSYFKMTEQRLPDNRAGILDCLRRDDIIRPDVGEHWDITNLGALLFANDLNDFDRLGRKAIRIIHYDGKSRAASAREIVAIKGYAAGFSEVIGIIDRLLPRNEHLGKALRMDRPVYPEVAVREITANALIHQDLTVRGAGPMVEVYSDRLEITNPGQPLVDVVRFLGAPPRSRNEGVAALMRRMKVCEERGQGIVKVVTSAEVYQLPAPDFRTSDTSFQVALYAPRSFKNMDGAERLRACYQHAILKYAVGGKMTNATLRERFGIEDQNAAQVSRIIKDALAAGLIRPADLSMPRAGYVPAWV